MFILSYSFSGNRADKIPTKSRIIPISKAELFSTNILSFRPRTPVVLLTLRGKHNRNHKFNPTDSAAEYIRSVLNSRAKDSDKDSYFAIGFSTL